MPEIDIRRKYTYGQKRKKKKKENFFTAMAVGLLPWKGDPVSDIVRKSVFLVSVCVLTFAVTQILDFYFGAMEESDYSRYWEVDNDCNETIRITIPGNSHLGDFGDSGENGEVDILGKYLEFYETNPEFVGYLSIDPHINYPVVQSQGDRPNDWYLKHDFYGNPHQHGTIFADKFGEFTPFSRPHNILIHGHNLINRNKFQPLMNYRDSVTTEGFPFLQENPLINFDTLYEPGVYKIFAVYQMHVNDMYGKYFDYWRRVYFSAKDDFFEYVVESLDRSQYHTDVDLRYGDELLTLSTCDFSLLSDIRLVIVARRVRPDEDPTMNPESFVNLRENNGRTEAGFMKYKMFDTFYRMSNMNRGWARRQWDISRVEGLDYDWLVGYDARVGFN
jgi:sortase B